MAEQQPQQAAEKPASGDTKANAADFLAAMARGDHTDESESVPSEPATLAPEPLSACPQCGGVARDAAAFCSTCGWELGASAGPTASQPASGSATTDVTDIVLEPIGSSVAGLADAAALARPVRRRKHQPISPAWRFAIPPLVAMAAAMLLLGCWAIAVLTRMARGPAHLAKIMLLAFPVALILLGGCVFMWKDIHRKR